MSTVEYREPTQEDIERVAAHMRALDAMEVAASRGHTPLEACIRSVAESDVVFAAVIDGATEGLFGFVQTGSTGTVWMLGTDDLVKDPALFRKETSEILEAWSKHVAVLHNFVDDENIVSKAWLKSAGFTLAEPKPYGHAQLPFRYFYRVGSGV